MSVLLREPPPLRLDITVTSPTGKRTRWAADEPDGAFVPGSMQFADQIPGGYKDFSAVLARRPDWDYGDTDELADITIRGLGGSVAWQGRLDQAGSSAGDQANVNPSAVGYQAMLDDDQSAREIFLDIALSRWQGPSVQRQIDLQIALVDVDSPTSSADFTTGEPALVTSLSGPWSREHVSEAWYDAQGIPIGELYYAGKTQAAGTIGDDVASDPNWTAAVSLADDDVASASDIAGVAITSPWQASLNATTATRKWALALLGNTAAAGGSGVNYPLYWTFLGVVGQHGCPLYGTPSATGGLGLLASDAVAYALAKWCPGLAFTTGVDGTIQPTGYLIPQLAVLDPGGMSAIVQAATAFELLDWAVWAGPTFWMNQRGARGRRWRARTGPARLQNTGPSSQTLYNGVILTWSDVATGTTRTAGPPGSGCDVEDARLLDPDPQNPANEIGIRKWSPPIQLGTGTAGMALDAGVFYLAEQQLVTMAGQATLDGFVEDADTGVVWPAWCARSGDSISFIDAANTSFRRIVDGAWDDSTKSRTISLDAPPDGMAQLLARYGASIAEVS